MPTSPAAGCRARARARTARRPPAGPACPAVPGSRLRRPRMRDGARRRSPRSRTAARRPRPAGAGQRGGRPGLAGRSRSGPRACRRRRAQRLAAARRAGTCPAGTRAFLPSGTHCPPHRSPSGAPRPWPRGASRLALAGRSRRSGPRVGNAGCLRSPARGCQAEPGAANRARTSCSGTRAPGCPLSVCPV